MSSKSACQVACSWVDVGSFHMHLFGVVYMTCGDFHDRSEKGTASVHQILFQSWQKCYGDPHNDLTSLRGPKFESCADVNDMTGSRPVAHQLTMPNTQGDPEAAQLLKLLHEFERSSIRINVGPFTKLLRRWELVMGQANGF